MESTFVRENTVSSKPTDEKLLTLPRLGFLGVGWIGRHRLAAVANAQAADVAAIADSNAEALQAAIEHAPAATVCDSLDQLLEQDLDGLVIATPNAMHAEQAQKALEKEIAVFCQKPLARTAAETRHIVETAQQADRLLGVDLSYRHVNGIAALRELVQNGNLGMMYAVELTFHNAYGPDKPWFYDAAHSGGGCVMDLGTHLVDLALWFFGDKPVRNVTKRLLHQGRPLPRNQNAVEDFAWAEWDFEDGPAVRMACSWGVSAGCDAVIEAVFRGTNGAAVLRNVNGSFYDFLAEHHHGRERTTIAEPPDAWGGRALVEWCRRLERGDRFDQEAWHFVTVATLIDRIYGR